MPRYKSHKVVHALQLAAVSGVVDLETGVRMVHFLEYGHAPLLCESEMFARMMPGHGDYLVVYADGYQSFSPKAAFEEGYTMIGPEREVDKMEESPTPRSKRSR